VHGDSHASRDWLVDDDAEAIEAIIEADVDAVAGEVVNSPPAWTSPSRRSPIRRSRCSEDGIPERPRRRATRAGRPPIGSTEKAERWPAGARSFEDGLERTVDVARMTAGGGDSGSRTGVYSSRR
jgi:hypothetical protein